MANREADQRLSSIGRREKRAANAKLPVLDASARVAQTRWLVAARRTREAAEAIRPAPRLLNANASYGVQFGVRLAEIDLALAQRNWNRAQQLIDRALAEATRSRSGFTSQSFLATELTIPGDRTEHSRRAELTALETKARAAGQELILLKAVRLGLAHANRHLAELVRPFQRGA